MIVDIALYHLFFDPATGIVGYVAAVVAPAPAWGYRDGFASIFEAKVGPN